MWHINCHSMPAVGDANADDAGGRARISFSAIGTGRRATPEFTALVAETVAGIGYSVAINDPYKGVEIVRRYGRPGERRHSLQIELNRRLYMDESDARAQLELSESRSGSRAAHRRVGALRAGARHETARRRVGAGIWFSTSRVTGPTT